NNFMLIGKGSLFLGRMTNLFDGISILVEKNNGDSDSSAAAVSKEEIKNMIAEELKKFASKMMEE
ncbi:DUF5940 domain-containing protein, partial [Clostridium drakei]